MPHRIDNNQANRSYDKNLLDMNANLSGFMGGPEHGMVWQVSHQPRPIFFLSIHCLIILIY